MPIVRIQRTEDMTMEMYHAVNEKVGTEADPPAGLIIHTVGTVDGQVQIVDVWESQEHADRFGTERLMPAIKSVAGDRAPTGPPRGVTTYEVEHLLKP